ncbi:uncharacterized protein LOC134292073 [Aedes albopictus]|uniref:Uncharacterized protein n=1 Tax=Aedes albopictus TaxID=7160 RepID=A0ABM1YVS4_AEDAL
MNRTKSKNQRKANSKPAKGNCSEQVTQAPDQSGMMTTTATTTPPRGKASHRSGKQGSKFKNVSAKVDTGRSTDVKPTECKQQDEPVIDLPQKMERANSFSLTRKLSKIYHKLSASRESLTSSTGEEPTKPFQFTRSLSLSSIQLKKNYRRSQNESNLVKLHEDAILEHAEHNDEPPPVPDRRSVPVKVEVPKLERSNSIIASFRRKISFRSESKPKMPSKWNTSLQNLRQEDYMVSYHDLSFVDYDQFNQYETHLERRLSASQSDLSARRPASIASSLPINEASNVSVIKRRQKTDHDLRRKTLVRHSFDFENNLDLDKNLYRNSIDDEKLKFLSKINRKSFRWSANVERDVDALNLDSLDQLNVTKKPSEVLVHSVSAEGALDVCDSGMVDGGESERVVEKQKSSPDSSSVGYVSRSESMKRSKSCNDNTVEMNRPFEQVSAHLLGE